MVIVASVVFAAATLSSLLALAFVPSSSAAFAISPFVTTGKNPEPRYDQQLIAMLGAERPHGSFRQAERPALPTLFVSSPQALSMKHWPQLKSYLWALRNANQIVKRRPSIGLSLAEYVASLEDSDKFHFLSSRGEANE
ncbi:unnamed protein product [Soboliphyme baturini]|uniref:Pro-kuma_activ domain-containing protein n=1 Tax=Soboliphyme baturini TaxID=241478 RepID=A0A183ICF2_9BILA|nr:unnamed protein product [Soboliphyme baturini]